MVVNEKGSIISVTDQSAQN